MDATQLQPGYRLDRYELLCPLAYGGMASVWLARFGGRLGFERMVVIKMILPQYSQDLRFQEMFLDEARIASRIEHPNVARILDVGEIQNNHYLVMEWIDGDSLSKVLRAVDQRKEPVPAGVAMRIVADAAAGLHAAHELKDRDGTYLGVVHRDVSPQNILVATSGATVIIDFGVAKARDRVSQETSAGQLKGKIRYMAPEQALGRSIDRRADVWGLGAMLYEMFTGRPPYDGLNEVATLHKLTSGQRPAPVPSAVPEIVRDVIGRALGYEPSARFATALELSLALEAAMVEIGAPTTPMTVAHYAAELLADRRAARKRAVDAALEGARRRDEQQASRPSFTPAPDPASTGASTAHDVAPMHPSDAPSAPSARSGEASVGQVPAAVGGASAGVSEAPSAASNATLGSANMEYFPQQTAARGGARRAYLAAGALGASVAAGVIGTILIVTAMAKEGDLPLSTSSGHVDPPATTTAVATTTVSEAPPPDSALAAVAAPALAPSASEAPAPASSTARATASSTPTRSGARAHKPATKPKPKPPAPRPTSTKVDRGF